MGIPIDDLRSKCADDTIEVTQHMLKRLHDRGLSYRDVKLAVMNGEIIEQYPNDHPYPSCLILWMMTSSRPLHVVVGLSDITLWFITAYEPDPSQWHDDWKTRKEQL